MRGPEYLLETLHDFRHGVRQLRRSALPFLPTGTNSTIPFEIEDRPAPSSGQRLCARRRAARLDPVKALRDE